MPLLLHGQELLDHVRPRRTAGRGVPQGLHRGDRGRRRAGGRLPRSQRRRHRRAGGHVVEHAHVVDRLDHRPHHRAREPRAHGRASRSLLFPKLALGHVRLRDRRRRHDATCKGDPTTTTERPAGRIRNTKKLLTAAALIMSGYLITTSLVTTLLIPAHEFEDGRRGQRTGARLPGAPVPRRILRHRSTTSPPSSSSGSPAPPRWPACSTSSRGTCPATEWRRSGRAPSDPLVLVLTGARVPHHLDLRRRRRRPGRRLRHRRTGADDLGRRSPSPSPHARARQRCPDPRVRGHHARASPTPPRSTCVERPDGVKIGALLHRRHHRRLDAVAPRPRLRAARPPRSPTTPAPSAFLRDCARRTIRLVAHDPDAARRDGVPRARSPRSSTTTICPTPATSSSSRSRSRTPPTSRARSRSTATSGTTSTGSSTIEATTIPNTLAALVLDIRDRTGRAIPHLLRVDGGQPPRAPDPLPALRPRRRRPGDSRGAATS